MRSALILGSGGLSIGQAGEFDYSGSQAIKALKEEGLRVILINPNIATIQTSEHLADEVYFQPVTPDVVERLLEKEKPECILVSFGGQTALNCAMELHKRGVFKRLGVKVLGTPVESIVATEDREIFAQKLHEISVPVPPSIAARSLDAALDAAKKVGYPVIVRAGFALGGLGSGFAVDEHELRRIVTAALALAPQVLVEKSLKGWKEIEYEMVRDQFDNCISVCNMENLDPLGVHTGDSIVVAPSQTLTNDEYHMLRDVAIKVVRHLGIIGECNIQYALDPKSERFFVIEVNARLSRSSALASKATGYPLAYVAAKLLLGKSLVDVRNPVTGVTTACFEPALDYIVVKLPRWDLKKFPKVSRRIGSSMKSVGEVMAIGRSFEEAMQKALRMVEIGWIGLVGNDTEWSTLTSDEKDLALHEPSDARILAVADAISDGTSLEAIHEMTGIDLWFLRGLAKIVEAGQSFNGAALESIDAAKMRSLKGLGFSDSQIGRLCGIAGNRGEMEKKVRVYRKKLGVLPVVKQIDTLAAEWPAKTNYLYMTYHGDSHDVSFGVKDEVIVLGGGPYRIGSSVEFDWCCVTCVKTLRESGKYATVVNCNPETVSTDYDVCNRLYFEELSLERVMDIIELESPQGIVLGVGGQTPNNLAMPLHNAGVCVLGTSPQMIDRAEDRGKFSQLLDDLKIDQPDWTAVTSLDAAKEFGTRVGYPLLVRPSYVLSGAAMRVVQAQDELESCLKEAARVSPEHPVVLSKFVEYAKEIEMDAVAQDGELLAYAISEHIEDAGVHSGDATLILPAQKLYLETVRRIKQATKDIAKALQINGPFNIQYLAKDNKIKVIECNLRCSRTFPFVSKVIDVDFVRMATRVMLGERVPRVDKSVFSLDYVGVKAPQFSFTRLAGADPVLGVEMASTGEVACLGESVEEAFLLALLSSGFVIPKRSVFLSTGPIKEKARFLDSAKDLVGMGYLLYASDGTARFLGEHDIPCVRLSWPDEDGKANVIDYLRDRKIDLVINIPKNADRQEINNDYMIRRTAVDVGVPLITNMNCAILLVDSLVKFKDKQLPIKSWKELVRN